MSDTRSNSMALLLDAKGAAATLGISERFFWSMHSSGELGPLPIRLRKRTLWSRFELTERVRARCPRREQWVESRGDCHAAV